MYQQKKIELNNVKLSLKFKHPLFKKKKTAEKITKKVDTATAVFYTHSPYLCNLTGVNSSESLEKIIEKLEVDYKNECVDAKIDAFLITSKSKGGQRIMLEKIKHALSTLSVSHIYRSDFEPELSTGRYAHPPLTLHTTNFLACYLKPRDEYRHFPTIIFFHTGTFQLMGGQSVQKIKESLKIAQDIISMCCRVNSNSGSDTTPAF